MSWQPPSFGDIRATEGALCFKLCDPEVSGNGPDLWFPSGSDYGLDGNVRLAVEICNRCPVREACLDMAMRAEGTGRYGRYGIYGGLTPAQRADLARKDDDDAA